MSENVPQGFGHKKQFETHWFTGLGIPRVCITECFYNQLISKVSKEWRGGKNRGKIIERCTFIGWGKRSISRMLEFSTTN